MSQPGSRYTVVDELLERVIRNMDAVTRQISISLQKRQECYEAHLLEINRREEAVRNFLGMGMNNNPNLPNGVNVDNRNNRTYTVPEQRGLNPNATYTIPRGNNATYTIPLLNDATYTIPRFNDATYTIDRGGQSNLFGRDDTNSTIRTNPVTQSSTSTGGYPSSQMSSRPEQSTQFDRSYLDSMQTRGFGPGIDSSQHSSSFKTSPTPNSTFSSGFTTFLDTPNSSSRSRGLTTDIPSTNSTLYETHLEFPMDYTTTSSNYTSGGDFSSVNTNGSSADQNRFQKGFRGPSPTTTNYGSSVSPRTMTTPQGSSFMRNAYDGPVIPFEFYDSRSSGNSNNVMEQLDSTLSQNATTNISSGISSGICIIHCPHCGSLVRIRANRSHGVICSQNSTSDPYTIDSSGTPGQSSQSKWSSSTNPYTSCSRNPGQSSQSQWSSTNNPGTSGSSFTPRQNNPTASSNITSNSGHEESWYTANGGGQTFRPVVNYSICEPNLPELIKRPNFIKEKNSKTIIQSEQHFGDTKWGSKIDTSRKRNAGKLARSSKNQNTGDTKRTKPNVLKKETASLKIKQIQEHLHSNSLDNNNVKKETKRNSLNVCTNRKILGSLPKGIIPSKGASIKIKSRTSVQSETFSYSSDRDHEFPSNSEPSIKNPFLNLVRSQKNILFSEERSDLDHLVGSPENLKCKSAAGNENKFSIRHERFSPTYTDELDELDENSNSSSWTWKMYDLIRRIQS